MQLTSRILAFNARSFVLTTLSTRPLEPSAFLRCRPNRASRYFGRGWPRLLPPNDRSPIVLPCNRFKFDKSDPVFLFQERRKSLLLVFSLYCRARSRLFNPASRRFAAAPLRSSQSSPCSLALRVAPGCSGAPCAGVDHSRSPPGLPDTSKRLANKRGMSQWLTCLKQSPMMRNGLHHARAAPSQRGSGNQIDQNTVSIAYTASSNANHAD